MRTIEQDHYTMLVNAAYSQAKEGCSININTLGNAPKVGYMVGLKSLGVYPNLSAVNPYEIKAKVRELHNGSNKNYLGVWKDQETGLVYFDLSEWIETIESAIQIGQSRGEIAIWDLKNECEIRL